MTEQDGAGRSRTEKEILVSNIGYMRFSFEKIILEDMLDSDSFSQFGGKKVIGAEHMLVCMVDRIFKLLETREGRAAVISSQYD